MKKFVIVFVMVILSLSKVFAFQKNVSVDPAQYFQSIAAHIQHYKYQIQRCYENTKTFSQCNGGMNGIDYDIYVPTGNIASLNTVAGVISVFPVAVDAILSNDSYILTPSISSHTFAWTATGGSVQKGYIDF